MNDTNHTLAKSLFDVLFALETASDEEVNPDFVVRLLEMCAAELQLLSEESQEQLRKTLLDVRAEGHPNWQAFVFAVLPDDEVDQ